MGDPWAVLGIERSATYDDARRAYLLRSQLLHPDRHQGATPEVLAESERSMRELNEAWEAVRSDRPSDERPGSGGRRDDGPMDVAAALDWALARMADAARDSGEPLLPEEIARLRTPAAAAPTGRAFDRWLRRRRATLLRATRQGDPDVWARVVRLLDDSPTPVVMLLLVLRGD
jgi:curved DNA-binding protein CbpA